MSVAVIYQARSPRPEHHTAHIPVPPNHGPHRGHCLCQIQRTADQPEQDEVRDRALPQLHVRVKPNAAPADSNLQPEHPVARYREQHGEQ